MATDWSQFRPAGPAGVGSPSGIDWSQFEPVGQSPSWDELEPVEFPEGEEGPSPALIRRQQRMGGEMPNLRPDRTPEQENQPIRTFYEPQQSTAPNTGGLMARALSEQVDGRHPPQSVQGQVVTPGRGDGTLLDMVTQGPGYDADLGEAMTPGQFAQGSVGAVMGASRAGLGGLMETGAEEIRRNMERFIDPGMEAFRQTVADADPEQLRAEGRDSEAEYVEREQAKMRAGLVQPLSDAATGELSAIADDLRRRGAEDWQTVEENRPEGAAQGWLYDVVTNTARMGPQLGIATLLRNPNAGLSAMFGEVYGNEYSRALDEGMSHEDAAVEGVLKAAYEVAPEKAFGVFDRFLSPGPFNRVRQALAEGGTEAVTSAMNIADEAWRKGEAVGSPAEIAAQIGYEASVGAGMGTLIGPGGRGDPAPSGVDSDREALDQMQRDRAFSEYDITGNEMLQSVGGGQSPLSSSIESLLQAGQGLLQPTPAKVDAANAGLDPSALDAAPPEFRAGMEDASAAMDNAVEARANEVFGPQQASSVDSGGAIQPREGAEPIAQTGDPMMDYRPEDLVATQADNQAQADALEQEIDRSEDIASSITAEQLPKVRRREGGTREWDDARLKRKSFRQSLQAMTSSLREGGGGMGRIDTYEGDAPRQGNEVIGIPSENPRWFQGIASNEGISVEATRKAVDKALRGRPLGEREARVVESMLDTVSFERMGGDTETGYAPDDWREMLSEYRDQRRADRGELTDSEIDARADELSQRDRDMLGNKFTEEAYEAGMARADRALYDLAQDASAVDEAATLEALQANRDETETIRSLWEITQRGQDGQGNEGLSQLQGQGAPQPQAQQGQAAQAAQGRSGGQPEGLSQPDLMQDAPTEGQQAAEGRRQQVDDRLQGQGSSDMLQGAGELFAGPRPEQGDVFGEAETDPLEAAQAESRALKQKRSAARQSLVEENGGAAEGVTAKKETMDQWAVVLPEMSDDSGTHRVQRFDERGFIGHSTYPSADAALDALVDEGYIQPDADALGRVSQTDQWDEGTAATQAAQEAMQGKAPSSQGADRRQDANTRRKADEMSPDELRAEVELLRSEAEERERQSRIDDMTGLGNRAAFEEALAGHDGPVVSIDADSLKWINDNLSPDMGDELLRSVGRAIDRHSDAGYHTSGDEFYLLPESSQAGESSLEAIESELAGAVLRREKPDGTVITKTGLQVTYGQGNTKQEADDALKQEKQAREDRGERAARGEEPPGVSREPAGVPAESREGRQADRDAAERPPVDDTPRRYSRNNNTFYSAVVRAVEGIQQNKAQPQQWFAMIQKQPGVKKEELEWLGLEQWLNGQEGSVSRDDLLQFLGDNQVQVEDVTLGETSRINRDSKYAIPEVMRLVGQHQGNADNALIMTLENDGDAYRALTRRFPDLVENEDWAEVVLNDVTGDFGNAVDTRYSEYQLPGGENYREILLTLTDTRGSADDTANLMYGRPYDDLSVSEQGAVNRQRADLGSASRNYRSSHFDEPNILAHVRFNERTDADGHRVLFIEEVQSDWHQEGRKRGYRTGDPRRNQDLVAKPMRPQDDYGDGQAMAWQVDTADGQFVTNVLASSVTGAELPTEMRPITSDQALEEARRRLDESPQQTGQLDQVPDAPFKQSWPMLAMKRMIRYASENGFDRIAWTPGDVQADRYDLSRHVERIEVYAPHPASSAFRSIEITMEAENMADLGDEGIQIEFDQKGTITNGGGMVESGKLLSDVVGKEMADKIMEADLGSELSGEDLKVGGEGMRNFYDRILKNEVGKYVKKLGSRVGTTEVETGDGRFPYRIVRGNGAEFNAATNRQAAEVELNELRETDPDARIETDMKSQQVWSVDVTPKMRETALAGQPMFARGQGGPGTTPDAFRSQFTPRAQRALFDSGLVNVTRSPSEWPGSHPADAAGVWMGGEIYLATDNIRPGAERGLILHEVGVHHGLRDMLGDQYDPLVSRLKRQVRLGARENATDAQKEAYRAHQRAQADDTLSGDDTALWEETVAYMAESGADTPLMKRIATAIRKFLRRMGLVRDFTNADIADLARGSVKRVIGQQLDDGAPATVYAAPMYQRSEQADSPADQTQTPEFQRWFGDSKVVDKSGRPKVVYHGTPDARGIFGDAPGFQTPGERLTGSRADDDAYFFTDSRGVARTYADDSRAFDYQNAQNAILQTYLSLQNPMVVNAGGKSWGERGGPASQAEQIAEAKRLGHDGLIIRNTLDTYNVDGNQRATVYVAFDPTQIKSAEPGPVRDLFDGSEVPGSGPNTGTFDPSNPDIRYSRTANPDQGDLTAGSFGTWTKEELLGESSDRLSSRLISGARGAFRSGRITFQDKLLPVKEAVEAARQYGTVRELTEVYKRAENAIGKTGDRMDRLERDHIDPLVKAMLKADVDQNELGEYLYAKHAPERNKQIAKINDAHTDTERNPGSGMSDSEAAEIVGRHKGAKKRQMEDLAKRVYAITESTKSALVDAGLITKDMADSWDQTYDNYIPLKGQDGDTQTFDSVGQGFDIRGQEVKRALGRRSPAKDILAQTLADAQRAIIRAEKNEVGKSLLLLALENPNSNLWSVNPTETQRKIDPATGKVVFHDSANWNRDDVFMVKVKGQGYAIQLEPEIAKAMKNLGAENMNIALRAGARLNRWLSYANTALNPEFVITNFFRDFEQSLIQLHGERGKELSKAVAKDVATMGPMLGAFHQMSESNSFRAKATEFAGRQRAKDWSDWFDRYRASGGKISFFRQESIPEQVNRINRILKQSSNTPGAAGRRAIKSAVDLVESLNGAVENAVRVATYKNAVEQGYNETDAAHMARDLTVNFNRRGEAGVMLNSLYLFYNASIQGTYRTFAALKHKRVRQIVGTAMAGQALLTMMNYMIAGEDDDGENRYEKIPDYEKSRNLIIMTPTGEPVKIPMPYLYSAFMSVPENLVGTAFGRTPSKATSNVLHAFMESVNPLHDRSWVNQLAPTAADPFIDIWQNQNFFGEKIMPENPYEDYDRPDSDKYWASVNPIALKAAKTLNRTTGGSDTTRGLVDVSPESLGYMFDHFLGAAGAFVQRTISFADNPRAAFEDNKAPFVRKLYGANTRFYASDQYDAAQKRIESVQEALDRFDAGAYENMGDMIRARREYRQENDNIVDLIGPYERAEKRLRRLYKRRGRIMQDNRFSDESRDRRIEEIEERINQVRADFLEEYNEKFFFTGVG